ncbi:FeoA family protein [Methanoplanus endosymbiosus]|uniref:Ferrous iron transport protein A n=1 Tax=Methanoplanus endosymbiosus TaxID=33865 RepID=A0A9E7PQK1_9EURY|nr:FeoA family protein [Methanoplanus endosymbiosus]UUX93542.1 ferrous iron transport protein A [Methanoplanus endosymbiosus]
MIILEKKLSELESGETGIVYTIPCCEHILNCLGIRPGKSVKMVTKQPIKGPVVVIVNEIEVAVDYEIAEKLKIKTE